MNYEQFKEDLKTNLEARGHGIERIDITKTEKINQEPYDAISVMDELVVLDGDKCILQLRCVRPFLSDKYDITQHPF